MEVYSELVESLAKFDVIYNNYAISCLDEDDSEEISVCIKINFNCADICHLTLGARFQHCCFGSKNLYEYLF